VLFFVLSGRGLCDELITRPEKSYRLWCVVVCDLETSWMRRPWPTGGCCAKRKKERKKERNGSLFGEGNKLESSSLRNFISFWATSQINTSASYFNVTRHGPLPSLILYLRCKIRGLKLSLFLQAWIYHSPAGQVTLHFFVAREASICKVGFQKRYTLSWVWMWLQFERAASLNKCRGKLLRCETAGNTSSFLRPVTKGGSHRLSLDCMIQ
jgi:hypothetical protein